jgi:hypothetical protein
MDNRHAVVANGCTRDDAQQIVDEHNKLDPIKSYDDWLYYRERK